MHMHYNDADKNILNGANMAANALVQARVNNKIKQEAAKVLADMGLTISDAVRILLTRVAKEKNFPSL